MDTFDNTMTQADTAAALMDQAQTNYDSSIQKLAADQDLTLQAKANRRAELDKQFSARVDDIRAAVMPDIDSTIAELTEAQRKAYRAIETTRQPLTLAEWQEAKARRDFIQEDIQQALQESPASLLTRHANAIKDGEKITVYLLERYGLKALQEYGKQDGYKLYSAMQKQINDAMHAADNGTAASLTKQINALLMARSRLGNMTSPQDREAIKARFNI